MAILFRLPITLVDSKYRENLFYNNRIKNCIYNIEDSGDLFFAGILSISFLLISVFYPIFSFLVHYSLIITIAPAILRIPLLFLMSSTDRNYNKELYRTFLGSLIEQW